MHPRWIPENLLAVLVPGVEIGSISVGLQGWTGMSRSVDSAWSVTTTEPRDTPREAFGELLRTLGFKA